jgi:hypothetical protein
MSRSQIDVVAGKYEAIYRAVNDEVVRAIEHANGDSVTRYHLARRVAAKAWMSALDWPWQESGYASKQDYVDARMAAEASWRENGIVKTGSYFESQNSVSDLYANTIRKYAPAGCDMVLDLGCGWGHRMIDLYLTGLDAFYIGGDRSKSSCDLVLAITALFPKMRAGWFPFNFLEPDYTVLPYAKRILVYTCHAVEQVMTVGTSFIDRLIEKFPKAEIAGVHLEPLAHQIDATRTPDKKYALERGYNMDLLGAVSAHPKLQIVCTQADVKESIPNGGNTTALLVWRYAP